MAKYWFQEADTYAKVADLGDVILCDGDFIFEEAGRDALDHLTPEREYDEEYGDYYDIYQYFFIDDNLASLLLDFSNEIILFDETTNCYIWGVTHIGTAWNLVPFQWSEEERTDYSQPWDVA